MKVVTSHGDEFARTRGTIGVDPWAQKKNGADDGFVSLGCREEVKNTLDNRGGPGVWRIPQFAESVTKDVKGVGDWGKRTSHSDRRGLKRGDSKWGLDGGGETRKTQQTQ